MGLDHWKKQLVSQRGQPSQNNMYGSNHLQRITKVRILFYLIPKFFDMMSPNMP